MRIGIGVAAAVLEILDATPASITEGDSTTIKFNDTPDTSVRFYWDVNGEEYDIETVTASPWETTWQPDEGTHDIYADVDNGEVLYGPLELVVTV